MICGVCNGARGSAYQGNEGLEGCECGMRTNTRDTSVPANTFITSIAGIGGYLLLPLVALVAPFVWLADSPEHYEVGLRCSALNASATYAISVCDEVIACRS